MANEYATVAELRVHLNNTTVPSDGELLDKLNAASRRVDRDTGRRFYLDLATSAKTYQLTHDTKLIVDDIGTTTGLVVQVGNGTSWSTVDSGQYRLLPENNLTEGRAANVIERINSCWPLGYSPLVQVTAKWGWPTVPDEIKAATLLVAARLYRRKGSPEGVSGSPETGLTYVSRYDPDYDWLIASYVKPVI